MSMREKLKQDEEPFFILEIEKEFFFFKKKKPDPARLCVERKEFPFTADIRG